MRAVDIITKKRDGAELTAEEIDYFIEGFTLGEIPDYQASSWAMAVLLKGMSPRETADLTLSLARSGDQLDFSDIVPCVLDKHSTGGVGDKTTLVVVPIVSASGIAVGKMSGRGLGFTGGTLDKMESIPGFRVDLTTDEFRKQLLEQGLVLTGQTADLAPADGKLYSLRDVTGTVPSVPLIASSVMSKKIAGGADAVVLDVKVGLGAFMETVDQAVELAELMVQIGSHSDRKVVALISDMNQPLGEAVGNAIEVREAIETLKGGGPQDLQEHCLVLASHMLLLAEKADSFEGAYALCQKVINNGSAFAKFKDLVLAQGGDISYVDDPGKLTLAKERLDVGALKTGYISQIHAGEVGLTAMELGAGRAQKGDPVDHSVGIEIMHNVGDRVEEGELLFTVYAISAEQAQAASERLLAAHEIRDKPVDALPLFYETIGSSDLNS
ncbi:MAG: thymidine phosphorylase [Chloroflexota bacterium]|nr:thymidine phosphorylase [Chloroflexota bacterium]